MSVEPDSARTDRIFLEARKKDLSERERFLELACAGDADLRKKVESLLAQDDSNYLAVPAIEVAAGLVNDASLIGQTIGRYHFLSAIGAGGMGQVYRAHDRKLEREVAIKVLPKAFAADRDQLERFQREAQALASLNHPNVGVIHDVVEDRGRQFLVLELIEGETLAARLKRGPLSVDEALSVLKQVAEALEAAHEKGIFHRDLKPANIQITPAGYVKVLDFGLAKMIKPETASTDLSDAPTISASLTAGRMILGTPAYMSPEQARGNHVDKRTDIWAFGCVLFETLTGKQAFAGETMTDIISSVMQTAPDWSQLPPGAPSAVRSLLRQCLQKQPKDRLHEIADARIAIQEALAEPHVTEQEVIPRLFRWRWIVPSVAIFAVIGAITIGWFLTRMWPEARAVEHFQINLQPADQLTGSIASVRPSRTAFTLSPDGKVLVFSGTRGNARPQVQLFSRALAKSEATPIPGTEDGTAPFFSPDGQWIGFFARGQIKKVSVGGGPPVVICNLKNGLIFGGASWADDGTIFFSDVLEGISKVSSTGGVPSGITKRDATKGELHVLPQEFSGGKSVIFTVLTSYNWEKAEIRLQSLESGNHRVLVNGGADARYVSTGHLLYMKAGTLMAVPFDAERLELRGAPLALMENVMQAVNQPNIYDETGAGQFIVSKSGALVYVAGGLHPELKDSYVWVDRKGTARPMPNASARAGAFVRLSPDEGRMAFTIGNTLADLWVSDILRGAATRVTFSGINYSPIWSPDGKRLVIGSNQTGPINLYVVNTDGGGQIERLTTSPYHQVPSSWTGHGNAIAFVEYHGASGQIWVLPLDGDRKPKLFLESQFDLTYPEFSPAGRWIAYVSPESGTNEVYVQPYPGAGKKHRISVEGGAEPIWAADGHELLYRSPGRDAERRALGLQTDLGDKFFSVAIPSLDPFRAETPRLLFESRPNQYSSSAVTRGWDVSRDGQRFLLTQYEESKDKPVTQLQIVLNWIEELKRRVPLK